MGGPATVGAGQWWRTSSDSIHPEGASVDRLPARRLPCKDHGDDGENHLRHLCRPSSLESAYPPGVPAGDDARDRRCRRQRRRPTVSVPSIVHQGTTVAALAMGVVLAERRDSVDAGFQVAEDHPL